MEFYQAFSNPSIALSGFVGSIIVLVFTTIRKMKGNVFRLNISLEESLFLNGLHSLIRNIYLTFIIMAGASVFSILATSMNSVSNSSILLEIFKKALDNNILVPLILIPPFVMSFFGLTDIQNWISKLIYSSKKNEILRKISVTVLMVFISLYCIFYSFLYGVLANSLLINKTTENIEFNHSFELLFKLSSYTNNVIWQMVTLIAFYFIALIQIKKVINFIGHNKSIVNVYLNNGKEFYGKYLINSDMDRGILIADSWETTDPNKHFVPKSNLSHISFNTLYFSLGKPLRKTTVTQGNLIQDEIEEANRILKEL